ncbi:g2858 [Coccomyxa viridis]|uniref:G2858 protein n=1 Tax=Coccomyxa viridis TaxID=1274662 RepID=A0ABP1FTD0_9CHLO
MKRAVRPELTVEVDENLVKTTDLLDELNYNSGDEERYADAAELALVLPPRSRFLIADITRLKPLLSDCPEQGFDCVVMDPPWENASAQRSAAYPTLPSRNLLGIPMKRLLHQERGVLALWVTNRERHRRFIDAELLPAWGLRHVATWHWLKVTDDGQLVSPLETAYRRPYEVLLLCQPLSAASEAAALQGHDAARHEHAEKPPKQVSHSAQQPSKPLQNSVIIAVPGQHSRKPHLGRLLAPHLPTQPSCLEVFARELHAGWTSIGNETLLFQTLDHFIEVQ